MEAIPSLLIEVCVDSVESAINAFNGGADRLEVCANLAFGGGTTPSVGLVRAIQRAGTDLSVMVMIRPRIGDFLYSKDEILVMLDDITCYKELGVRGFVVGALTKDGRVDVDTMKRLVDEILPLEVCFHRAFDMTRDAEEALQDIIEIGGISRVLTSGHGKSVSASLPTLDHLFTQAKSLVNDEPWGLTIMPGSGITGKTALSIVQTLLPKGLREIHLSGGSWIDGGMQFKREGMGMGVSGQNEWRLWRTLREDIQSVREIADIVWDDYWDNVSVNGSN